MFRYEKVILIDNYDHVIKLTYNFENADILFSLDAVEDCFEITIDESDYVKATNIMKKLKIVPLDFTIT
jgi:hypothetical protein